MSRLTRRGVLRFGGSALATGLAGCSAFGEQPSPPLRLGELDVHNYDLRPHAIHVAFFDDGTPVYRASKDVPSGDEYSPGFADFRDYPTQPDENVLQVWVDDQPKARRERFDFSELEVPCLGLLITIGSETGTEPGKLTIWQSTSENECDRRVTE